jgi:ATP-dependent DNA ligase
VTAPGKVELRSRHGRSFARYFPEIVEALDPVAARKAVIDGELVVTRGGVFDFAALLCRLHPARTRVERLRGETPATLLAFDLLALDGVDLRDRALRERRARLEDLFDSVQMPLMLTPATREPELAREWLRRFQGAGIDGVVAKHEMLPYQPGRRGWVKVKTEHSADCVVAGLRVMEDGAGPFVTSLLLGLFSSGALVHVGVSSSFPAARRRELFLDLRRIAAPLAGHPWERGFNLGPSPIGRLKGSAGRWDPEEMEQDWLPVRPVRVCEVGYDQIDGGRFRHPARFLRWRPDREAASCGFDQLAVMPARLEGLVCA